MTIKAALLHGTRCAYEGEEMSLLCEVYAHKWVPPDGLIRDPGRDLTDAVARIRPETWHRSILDILTHVAECKTMYMIQAFGPPPHPLSAPGDSLQSVLRALDEAHGYLVACLERIDEAELGKPVPTNCHGETAANLFWVLAQHDVSHGSQIGVLRAMAER